jgi:oligoribonuclease
MATLKTKPSKLLWVDLEMTGLDPKKDVILEIAALVTDFDFKILDTYEARIKHDSQKVEKLLSENVWYQEQVPENRDEFLKSSGEAKSLAKVEEELIKFVSKNFPDEPATLAGNSVHFDRTFIKVYWPKFDKLLHYRILDVSSWKIIMNIKYNVDFMKKNTHRALDDIRESINELKFYLDWIDNNKPKK